MKNISFTNCKEVEKAVILLSTLLLGIFLVMLPLREQAFRDDFAYAWSVRHLVETGEFKLSEFTTAADITPTFWGALWSQVFGFSFKVLHGASYFLFSVGVMGFFFLLKEVGLSDKRAVIFCLLLLSNPWILNFTMSYMTDIPAMSLMIVSLYLVIRGLREASFKWLVSGAVAGGLAFLTRQMAISIGFGLAAALVAALWRRERQVVLPLTAATAVFWLVVLKYFGWLVGGDHRTLAQVYNWRKTVEMVYGRILPLSWGELPDALMAWNLIFHRIISFLSQIIVFTLPVWLITRVKLRQIWSQPGKRRLTFVSGLLLLTFYAVDLLLNREGYTAGYPVAAFEIVPIWPWFWPHLWKYFLGVGIILGAFIPALAAERQRRLRLSSRRVLVGVTFGFYLWLTVSHNNDWPQYGIQLLPLAFLFLAWATKRQRLDVKLTAVAVSILLIYSVSLARFRYQLTGDVWQVCEGLVAQGFLPAEIECHGQYVHRWWHEFEVGVAEKLNRIGREQYIETNDWTWSDRGVEDRVMVKVIYQDSLVARRPEIVVEKVRP